MSRIKWLIDMHCVDLSPWHGDTTVFGAPAMNSWLLSFTDLLFLSFSWFGGLRRMNVCVNVVNIIQWLCEA
jgi:hypothetical protein